MFLFITNTYFCAIYDACEKVTWNYFIHLLTVWVDFATYLCYHFPLFLFFSKSIKTKSVKTWGRGGGGGKLVTFRSLFQGSKKIVINISDLSLQKYWSYVLINTHNQFRFHLQNNIFKDACLQNLYQKIILFSFRGKFLIKPETMQRKCRELCKKWKFFTRLSRES